MEKIRLKNVCILNPLPEKKFKGKIGSFLPMEKVENGVYDNSLKLLYDQKSVGYTFMKDNDVIRAIITPCFENNKGTLVQNLENGFGLGSTEFMCLRPTSINSKFLYYITMSEDFKNYALQSLKGVGGLKRISSKFSLNYTINNYTKIEQIKIANYLDIETSKIDHKISILEQKFDKLEEYKQSLIFETVTKGLYSNISMKDSGINWIGEIPKHWEVKRVKDCLKLKSGDLIDKSKEMGHYPIFGANGTIGKTNKKNIKNDTILIGRVGSAGSINLVSEGFASDNSLVVKLNKNQLTKYFYYYFKIFKFDNIISKTSHPLLVASKLLRSLICIPNILEQEQISIYLNQVDIKIEKKKEIIKKKIKLLKEYKQTIIYEAVTGKREINE